ncbi:MAG: sulfatase, partial [Phycisphaerales bacterium]
MKAPGALYLRATVAVVLLCAGAWAYYGFSSRGKPPAGGGPEHPNILVIMWDTVRADRLSAYGYDKPTTPYLEQFAAESSLYERAISPGIWTLPYHASLFTGLPITAHGATAFHKWIDSDMPKLAETLTEAGYDTYMFSSNPFVSDMSNSTPGFQKIDYVWDPPWSTKTVQAIRAKLDPRDRSNALAVLLNRTGSQADPRRLGVGSNALTQSGPVIKEALAQWLQQRDSSKPFFAYLNYMEAHFPRIPSLEARRKLMTPVQIDRSLMMNQDHTLLMDHMFGRYQFSDEDVAIISGVYDANLIDLDATTHDLIDMLQEQDLLDETVVVITSDHGENLGDHGQMGHKYSVHNSLTRVPLVIRYPPRVPARRVTEPVAALDLYATLLDLANVDPPQETLHSVSLLASPELRPDRDFFISEMLAPATTALQYASKRYPDLNWNPWMRWFRAIEKDDRKFIWSSDGRHELYDLNTDPGENRSLYRDEPGQA